MSGAGTPQPRVSTANGTNTYAHQCGLVSIYKEIDDRLIPLEFKVI